MEFFVPGRICLFGEHSDWAGGYRRVDPDLTRGYTLICGTDQGIYARVQPHPNALVLVATTPGGRVRGPYHIVMDPQVLLAEAQRGGFWSYVAGTAYQAALHHRVRGLVVENYRTDLPIKKGLSSSAAICVLVARALNHIYDLRLTTRGEMEMAYQGEVTTPSRCGRMDQGCAFGNRPVLMTFDGDRLETAELHTAADLHFVIVDLRAQKNTMEILARLNRCYPNASDEVSRGVRTLLGQTNKRIVHQAVEALQAGDARQLGALMVEAQSHFDRYAIPACPEELTAPVLHRVLGYGPLQPHVWGGKGMGSQGDGAAQFVARSQADQQAAVAIIERDLGMPCLTLTLPANHAPPARRPQDRPVPVLGHRTQVRKAVIPAAGLGTRLYPASAGTKKELFPIVDRDGLAKPALLLIVEEALASGLEEVILVIQEDDLAHFRSFFAGEDTGGLPHRLQACARRIAEIGCHLSYVLQPSQDGFGHAVYRAREAVGGEPFLLMLGDHLYRSAGKVPCGRQLLDVYDQHHTGVLALRRAPEREIVHYGTVAGRWLEDGRLLDVTRIAEKPAADYARANLRVPGFPEGEYLALFGLYVLEPRVFDLLEEQIDGGGRERGEVGLTPALQRLREEDGFLGLAVAGQCYDIGLPESYLRALQAFAGPRVQREGT